MSESIYVQLTNQSVLTPVNGTDYNHPLPTGLFPTVEQFESTDQLVAWAEENSFTAKLIQKGLQKAIIEVRACFKSCKKDDVWDEEMGLASINAMEWKTVDRPNQAGTKSVSDARYKDCMAMIVSLTENKMPVETIKTMTVTIYSEDIVNAIFEALEKLKA